jgi:transposase
MEGKAYPSDVSDEEWAPVAPYLTLMTEDAPQRDYPLREVFKRAQYRGRRPATQTVFVSRINDRDIVKPLVDFVQ